MCVDGFEQDFRSTIGHRHIDTEQTNICILLVPVPGPSRATEILAPCLVFSPRHRTVIRTRTKPSPTSIHRAADGLAPPASTPSCLHTMSAFAQTHRPSFTAAEPTKTLDSSTDVIVAQIYRCHMDPVQNKSSRESVGVYSATTMQVIPEQLLVKMSGEDSIHREFAVLNYLHKCHPVKAVQSIVKVKDFVHAVVGQHEHAIFMEKGDVNLGDYLPQLHLEPRVEQDSIAWTLLSVCGFISDCGIVWGDVKPGNFVRF